MNVLTVEPQDHDASALHRSSAPALEPNVPDAPVRIEMDGKPVMVIGRYPPELLGRLRHDFRTYRTAAFKAGNATVSRTGGSRTDTTAFGFQATQPLLRRMSCRLCGAGRVAPVAHHAVCEAASHLDVEMGRLYPERAAEDSQRARAAILPEWMLGTSHWTSGVLNLNSPIAYHYDANNLPCWSAMVVVRRGMRGGHLHIPAYGLVVPCRDGDIVYFPGYETLHSVTPMRKLTHDAYRFTAVYYTIARMAKCGPGADQVALSQMRHTNAETGLLARQRAEGLMSPEATP